MSIARLNDRAILALSGDGVGDWLQGLVTNDVEHLKTGDARYAALLTPQGKILFDFFVVAESENTLLIDCLASRREALQKRLSMYRLRAPIAIAPREDMAVYASWDGAALPGLSFADPRHPSLGTRAIAAKDNPADETETAYHAHRLSLAVPEGEDFGSEKLFALEAGLEDLHGVSFTKGCYVGQELTARMKHKTTLRKRLVLKDGQFELVKQ